MNWYRKCASENRVNFFSWSLLLFLKLAIKTVFGSFVELLIDHNPLMCRFVGYSCDFVVGYTKKDHLSR